MTDPPEVNLKELDEKALLLRIAQELGTLRKLVTDVVQYARGAEKEIPEFMRRFMNYMHDLHDIRYMFEEVGIPPPPHLLREQERCDDRFRQLLKDLHEDGNAFEKIRRDMAEDPENKWDHTRQLQFKGKSEGKPS